MDVNRANILVIDDDVIMQRLIMTVLTRIGYDVRASGDVRQGLQMIEEQMPDLVLCDMALPILTGLDFLRHCRVTPELDTLKVVIISSVSDERNVREALDLGAVAHLSKPFSQAQLMRIVADNLPPPERPAPDTPPGAPLPGLS